MLCALTPYQYYILSYVCFLVLSLLHYVPKAAHSNTCALQCLRVPLFIFSTAELQVKKVASTGAVDYLCSIFLLNQF